MLKILKEFDLPFRPMIISRKNTIIKRMAFTRQVQSGIFNRTFLAHEMAFVVTARRTRMWDFARAPALLRKMPQSINPPSIRPPRRRLRDGWCGCHLGKSLACHWCIVCKALLRSFVSGPSLTTRTRRATRTKRWYTVQEAAMVLLGHANSFPVFDVSWNRDGRALLSTGGDGSIRLWDTMAKGTFGSVTKM